MSKEILKITGTLIEIGDMQEGTSQKSGKEWKKQEFVIKPEGKYAKPICFSIFNPAEYIGDKHKLKDFIEVCFDLESRQYKDKWYTNANAWETRTLSGNKEDVDFREEGNKSTTGNNGDDQDLPF